MVKRKNTPAAAILVVFALFLATGCGGNAPSHNAKTTPDDSSEKRGEEIVAEFLKRDASPFRKLRVRFTVTTEDEPAEIYELDVWRKQTADSTITLSQIVRPVYEAGATLSIENAGQKTSVITYAAARNEFRETDTNKMFIGGLTAGELLGEWYKFTYRFVGEKEANGRKVFEVEGALKDGFSSSISKMSVLFRADDYVPAELHLFDVGGREIRTYRMTAFNDDPVHPYATRTEVDNPIRKAKIVVDVLSRELPATIDDATFTREKLKELAKK